MFDILEVVVGLSSISFLRVNTASTRSYVVCQSQAANWSERIFRMWPSVGVVEDVEPDLGSLIWRHDLDVQCPGRTFSSLDSIVQIFDVVIGLFTGKPKCYVRLKSLDSGIWFPVPFHVDIASIL